MLTHAKPKLHPTLLRTNSLTISSINNANKYGDNTPPCRIPHFNLIKTEKQLPQRTVVTEILNQYSRVDNKLLGNIFSISLMNNP